MTPRQVTKIDFTEIDKVEITCNKCGAVLTFPVPQEKGQEYPPDSYACLGCKTVFWNNVHDDRYSRVYRIFESLAHWKALKGQNFELSFSLFSN